MNTLREALVAVEEQLASAEPRLAELQKRIAALRQTQAGLRSVLALDKDSAEAGTTPLVNVQSLEELEEEAPHPGSTVEGIQTILRERVGQPVHLDEVRAEFRHRGWIDPSWARPEATVYSAMVRLEQSNEDVERVGKRLWQMNEAVGG